MTERLVVSIDLTNESFTNDDGELDPFKAGQEVKRLLTRVSDACSRGGVWWDETYRLHDANGNPVGSFRVEDQ